MAIGRRTALGLVVVSWIALAVAFVEARSIPQNYCNYEGPPSATVTTEVALFVAQGDEHIHREANRRERVTRRHVGRSPRIQLAKRELGRIMLV